MPLAEVGSIIGKMNKASSVTALNSMYPEHSWSFLNSSHLGTIDLQIIRIYYTFFWFPYYKIRLSRARNLSMLSPAPQRGPAT
jgi:hypothetical protein